MTSSKERTTAPVGTACQCRATPSLDVIRQRPSSDARPSSHAAKCSLPRRPLLAPAPQEVETPLLAPNVAGDREARLIAAEQRLYLLGVYGADFDGGLTIRVGVVAGSGRVLGIRARPLTTADFHPQVRPYHPGVYHPEVCYFNASLTAFVEIARRWLAAVKVIRAHPAPLPVDDLEQGERYYAELNESRSAFLAGMAEIDPTLIGNNLNSPWVEAILED